MQRTLLKNISIIIGFLFCLFILWNRLLRSRKPVDLFTEYNIIRICIYFSLCIVSMILIIYFVCQVFAISSKRAFLKSLLEKPRVVSIISFIQEYILNAPKNLYEWLYLYIKIRPIIDECCKFIQKYSIGDKPAIIMAIILSTASFRVIVCMIFIYAVFYTNNLSYFYNSLPLLLIPVLFSIFLYSIHHLATNNKKAIQTYVRFTYDTSDNNWIISRTQEYVYFTDEQLTNCGNDWVTYLYSIETLDDYSKIDKDIKVYVNISCYSLYAIGWGYTLYRIYLNNSGSEAFQWLWIIQDIVEPFSGDLIIY